MRRVTSVSLAILALSASGAAARTHDLERAIWNTRVTCPSGRFTAEQRDENDHPDYNLIVSDHVTGTSYKLGVNAPIFFLGWTAECDTIVVIEHITGGSQVSLLHFDGHQWQNSEVHPPDASGYWDVLQCHIEPSRLRLRYKFTHEERVGHTSGYYVCSFTVDPVTTAISDVQTREITRQTYLALHGKA